MGYLPFENTTVSARRSISEIQDLLDGVGFNKTATITDNGRFRIIAVYKTAQFCFEIEPAEIITALINAKGERTQAAIRRKDHRGREVLEKIQSQADRIGWRFMRDHIKNVCDGIKLRVMTPADAFAGQALITDKRTGGTIKVAQLLTAAVESETPLAPDVLMLPDPGQVKGGQ